MTVLQFPDQFCRARAQSSAAWAAPRGPAALGDAGTLDPSPRHQPVGGLAHGAVPREGQELAGPALAGLDPVDPHAHGDEDLGEMAVIAYLAGAGVVVGVAAALWHFGPASPVAWGAVGLTLFGAGLLALIRYLEGLDR